VGRSLAEAYGALDPDLVRHLGQTPVAGISLLLPGRSVVKALPGDGHRPVVFVHGLGGGPGNFTLMRSYFRFQGRSRTYTIRFPSNLDLPALAARLGTFIARVVDRNHLSPRQKIDVVAHSMGGVVARLALEDPSTARRVATLVTLGTPHRGTHAARLGNSRHVRALRPGSPVMDCLETQLPWRKRRRWPRLVAFWSPADMLLLPATSAQVEGAVNVEVKGFTHYDYLLHPGGWATVYDVLLTT
jgi:pimeloyl-ACP methyl ester carboxylesterase